MENKKENKETEDLVNKFKALVAKTSKESPREKDIEQLRLMLKEHPELLDRPGHMAQQAVDHMIKNAEGPEIARQLLAHNHETRLKELGYYQAPPIEKLLIEQVALCWVRHNMLEHSYTAWQSIPCSEQKRNLYDKLLTRSQQRYLRACESLARVRKLSRNAPGLQINLATEGGQQVNVTGDLTMFKTSEPSERN